MGFFTKTKVEDKDQRMKLFICPSCGNSVSTSTAKCSCGQNVEDKEPISWDAISLNEAINIAKKNKLKPSRVKGTKGDINITDGRDPRFEAIDWEQFKKILEIKDQKVWYNESQNELRILGPHEGITHTGNEMRKDSHDAINIIRKLSEPIQEKSISEENLSRVVKIFIPEFLDIGATGEMTFEFDNVIDKDLENISVDFTNMANFFDIQNEVTIPILASGMSVRSRVRFKCKFEEGVFPVRICLICGNTSIEKQFKVKVGGTEIY